MLTESKWAYEDSTDGERTAVYDATKEVLMKKPAAEYVTLVEVLERTAPFEEFQQVVEAALGRLEAEGVKELVSINFYGEPDSTEVGAILIFSDRERMTEHMGMVSSWEEFGRFFAIVKPLDVRVYGRLSAEAETWIRQFGNIVSRKFEHHAAGFVR
jgi:hypothetical protein